MCRTLVLKAWSLRPVLYELTEWSTTLIYPASDLRDLCRFAHFSPTVSSYPHPISTHKGSCDKVQNDSRAYGPQWNLKLQSSNI